MAILGYTPTESELHELMGDDAHRAWTRFTSVIETHYDTERIWSDGGRKWDIEYKYRRGGKTLCALYCAKNKMGLMIIFGAGEREKVAAIAERLSPATLAEYDGATTYRDGRWVMFGENLPTEDLLLLLGVKRRPNR